MEIQQTTKKCNCGEPLHREVHEQKSQILFCPVCGEVHMFVRNRFDPGTIVITQAANAVLPQKDVLRGLFRHLSGDWGELCREDWEANEVALIESLRLFSSYVTTDGRKFWLITEHDRSVTTILLPTDY